MASTYEIDRIISIGTKAAGGVGLIGAFTGGLEATAGGIAAAVLFAFVFALIFKSKTKN